jgi:hypothetical protein
VATVSWLSLKTKVVKGFSVWASKPKNPPQNRQLRFDDLASKLPRRFLGLCLKTKHILICRLRHKTDVGRLAQDKHQDILTCFVLKQVRLGFLNLAKTGGGATVGGARGTIVKIASESS